MMTEAMSAWILSVMLAAAPPGRTQPLEAIETSEEAVVRYAEIARSITDVVLDAAEPPLFRQPAQTAALILAVSYLESAWRKDVDLGIGRLARGDSGASWCMMQIHLGRGKTPEGWSGPDLVASRDRCFRTGLRALRRSVNACRARPMGEWLNAYASGACTRGAVESRRRVGLAMRWYATRPRTTEALSQR
jgi:hypothetical protein